MTVSDLIERLRNAQRLMFDHNSTQPGLYGQAAGKIERLTARLIAESGEVEDLVNRLQESEDDNGRLMKRIAKLEAACKVQTEMAPERTVPEIWKALANSEGRGET